MPPVVRERVQCPRCGGRGARELNRLPEEGHPVLMCPFCKHGTGVATEQAVVRFVVSVAA